MIPFIEKKRCTLKLSPQQSVLVLFDRFKGQCTQGILSLLDKNNILYAIVPANCTDCLQPLDVSINKAAKECLRRQFQEWYSNNVCQQLEEGKKATATVVKPLSVKWLISVNDYIKSHPEMIKNGFKEAGILQ